MQKVYYSVVMVIPSERMKTPKSQNPIYSLFYCVSANGAICIAFPVGVFVFTVKNQLNWRKRQVGVFR